jgi:hypothetical protein
VFFKTASFSGANWKSRLSDLLTFFYSFNFQDLLEVYLLLLLVYCVLTPLQFYAVTRQKHPITRLLAAALTSQIVALLSISIHFLLFAWNGQGVPGLENFGEIVEIFSTVTKTKDLF